MQIYTKKVLCRKGDKNLLPTTHLLYPANGGTGGKIRSGEA